MSIITLLQPATASSLLGGTPAALTFDFVTPSAIRYTTDGGDRVSFTGAIQALNGVPTGGIITGIEAVTASSIPLFTIAGLELNALDVVGLIDQGNLDGLRTLLLAAPDSVAGSGGNDLIAGGGSSDTINGGEGGDNIDGQGDIDVAQFSGSAGQYSIGPIATATSLGFGISGPDGGDFLQNVEFLRFGDGPLVAIESLTSIGGDGLPGNITTGAKIHAGESVAGTLEVVRDSDWYCVDLVGGVPYRLELRGSQSGNGTIVDPFLRLYDSHGVFITSNDDSGVEPARLDSLILFTPSQTDKFYLEAREFNDDNQGTYRLVVSAPLLGIVPNTTVTEGDGGTQDVVLTLRLAQAQPSDVSIDVSTADGSALAGQDYQAVATRVTIPAGETSANVTIPIIGDRVPEATELFRVLLSNASTGVFIDPFAPELNVTIEDDGDAFPQLSIASITRAEGNAGVGNAVFTLSLSDLWDQDVGVTFSTANGSASAASDYTATSSVVTIPAGQTSASFSVPILGDTALEIDETFFVSLSSPTGGAVLPATGTLASATIQNDDQAASIAINGQSLAGGNADDFLVGTGLSDSIDGQAGNDTEIGNLQGDVLIGGEGNDFIVADQSLDFLAGGADRVDAGAGDDFVFGGGGNDTLIGGGGNDLVAGDAGDNLIFGGDGDNALFGFDGADTILGGNDGDIVFGLSGADVIVTQGGLDLIIAGGDGDGAGDADYVDMGAGGGTVFAGAGDDTVLAAAGNDFILGESGADSIASGDGDDALIAGPGNDTLAAGAGADLLIGEDGDDRLEGGAGADLFRYPAGIAVGNDRVLGFAPADDTVELDDSLGFASGALAVAAVAQQGADAVLTLSGGSITFIGLDVATLSASDFVIV